MTIHEKDGSEAKEMKAHFEASLQERVQRASKVTLQEIIPNHWFSVAASECAGMYISGYFYGAISVAQAYVEALSKYLSDFHNIRIGKDAKERCKRLHANNIISEHALSAATDILSDRNDYHHLNAEIEQEYNKLEVRAKDCINHIHTLESEVFAHSFASGKILPAKPEYWPSNNMDLVEIYLRKLW